MENINQVNPINMGSASPSITVPALKYKSGNRIWYAVTLPYRVLGKFIHTSSAKKKNTEIIQSEIRNRFLDRAHKNEIKNYIMSEKEFTIPPVTLTSFEELDFRPYTFGNESEEKTNQRFEAVGSLAGVIVLPIDYEFECLDGNHRTVAIRELAEESPDFIADSNILLNIVFEKSTRKIRQDFVDVNQNAKQTSSSINTLFNTRDKVSNLVVDLIDQILYLNKTTELLSTSVSKNSHNLFTINNLKSSVIEIAGYNSQSIKSEKLSAEFNGNLIFMDKVKNHSILFFEELANNEYIQGVILAVQEVENKKTNEFTTISNIRNKNVLTSGTGIIVAARIAGHFVKLAQNENELKNMFHKIALFDWSRQNPDFANNIIGAENKILNSRDAINSATEAVLHSINRQDS